MIWPVIVVNVTTCCAYEVKQMMYCPLFASSAVKVVYQIYELSEVSPCRFRILPLSVLPIGRFSTGGFTHSVILFGRLDISPAVLCRRKSVVIRRSLCNESKQ